MLASLGHLVSYTLQVGPRRFLDGVEDDNIGI